MDVGNFLYFVCMIILLMCINVRVEGTTSSKPVSTTTLKLTSTTPPTPSKKFCNSTEMLVYDTKCVSCAINQFVDCPNQGEKLTKGEGTPGCQYEQSLGLGVNITRAGCVHTCRLNVTQVDCCDGYWGRDCQECPGGVSSPCSAHGNCSDGIAGTGQCTCLEHWTGYACEFCLNGAHCTKVSGGPCEGVSCPENSDCQVVDSQPACTCRWPYVNMNSTDHDHPADVHINCVDITKNMCKYPPFCHKDATCVAPANVTVDSIFDKCTCNSGFMGDGYSCVPFDPCQSDNGGCNMTTTVCVNTAPAKSTCECLPGYHEYVPDFGCALQDMCPTLGPRCSPVATCKTEQPMAVSCKCPTGYEGDGQNCYGNILLTIEDLDEGVTAPELKGQLSLVRSAIATFYRLQLTQHGPFTMFVPTNEGFRGAGTSNFQKWLENEGRVKQVLRQHILVGDFTVAELRNQTLFYTLQGTPAQLLANNRGTFKYKILGDNKKARILKGNVVTSNGFIHIINRLMTNAPVIQGDTQKTVLQLIQDSGAYNKLQSLLAVAGSNVTDLLLKDNVTMFVTNNGVWESLPDGSLDHLKSPEGIGSLIAILKNHIFDGRIEMVDLINTRRLQTLGGMYYDVSVTSTGRVQFNGEINVTHADILASNGLMLELDAILIPDGHSTLPNFCNVYTYALATGPCGDCREPQRCYTPDVLTNITVPCTFFEKNSTTGTYEKLNGCAAKCNRTYTNTNCCAGFYGFDCLPCPGGYQNPCSGNGVCAEGYLNNGTCACQANFGGQACDKCSREGYFGPGCDQECTCLHGYCDDGPQGTGICKQGTFCKPGYAGSNCDKHLTVCPRTRARQLCHAHATCVVTSTGDRCVCNEGYKGDGDHCVEIDPCLEPSRGNCHRQATCTKLKPGVATCSCNRGWTGDGTYCYPATACRHHMDCNVNAVCLDTSPGQYICQCRSGYHGNGTSCVQTDMCEDNKAGCHPKATCKATGPGRANCTCRVEDGYSGDGFTCYGNIVQEIKDHPNLTIVAGLLVSFEQRSLIPVLDRNMTLFAPNDLAMMQFGVKHQHNSHWYRTQNVLQLMGYHSVLTSSTVEDLVKQEKMTTLVNTMMPGYTLNITQQPDGTIVLSIMSPETGASGVVTERKIMTTHGYLSYHEHNYTETSENKNTIVLMSPETGASGVVRERNIMTTHGYLNVIDGVLEPYVAPSPDNLPTLSTFFTQHPEYSTFGQWLQDLNLTQQLEDKKLCPQGCTLFVPDNNATKLMNRTVTMQFLLYYLLPQKITTAQVNNGTMVPTVLGLGGEDHQLVYSFNSQTKQVEINGVTIVAPDILIKIGVVNGISGLLHPVLHICNETVRWKPTLSACTWCRDAPVCPDGYDTDDVHSTKTPCQFSVTRPRAGLQTQSGCQILCVPSTEIGIQGCCDGYYGPQCLECPGGPERPCNLHGTCNDKINGTGLCTCRPKFTGASCDACIDGWAGPNCDIDKSGCGYQNGGCDKNAVCDKNVDGVISCKCSPGYRGNGNNCVGPCEMANGGCLANATCTYKVADGVSCQCKPGLLGDGKLWCNGDVIPTLAAIDRANIFLKSVKLASEIVNRTADDGMQYTFFVPVDESLADMTLNTARLMSQIVKANKTVRLGDLRGQNLTVVTMSGYKLYIRLDKQKQQVYVNNTAVLEGNIPCNDGLIHLMSGPFQPPVVGGQAGSTSDSGVSPVGPAVAGVLGLVVIVIVVAIVVVYQRSKFRYWKLLQRWYPHRKDSDQASLETPLNFTDHEDDGSASGLPSNTKFGNPLYLTDEIE